MGQIIVNETQAMAALEILCPSGADPELSVDDLSSLLDRAKRAVIWSAVTSYDLGAVVIPVTRNGSRFQAISFDGTGTTSGTTEPSWGTTRSSQVTDGHITWEEVGPDYDSLWDITKAAYEGWLLKAGRAICAIDVATENKSFKQSQIYDHCISQARQYAPHYLL